MLMGICFGAAKPKASRRQEERGEDFDELFTPQGTKP